ncbi:MAG: hypothetical protein ACOYXY_05835 [Thermodesulfobacteriota bacterium]
MKREEYFFNPFRLISPKLDAEATRLEELYEKPPEEVTCLEEGLLIMISKLIQMVELGQKALIIWDPAKAEICERLGREIHDEEKSLTGQIVCSPTETTGQVLKTVVLFPGRLERVGDHLESILNVARIKARDGIPFSDRATVELDELFTLFADALKNFQDALLTRNKAVLEHVIAQDKKIAQKTIEAASAHEDRLCQGDCSPKASSLFLDILESIRAANSHVRQMCENLLKIDANQAKMA